MLNDVCYMLYFICYATFVVLYRWIDFSIYTINQLTIFFFCTYDYAKRYDSRDGAIRVLTEAHMYALI